MKAKKRINKKEKKELKDYKKYIIPFFEKGYTITDMFRIKNMAGHIVPYNPTLKQFVSRK